jgi:UDP-N-acetyl-D-mannosaminuronic acid dehydrogenase
MKKVNVIGLGKAGLPLAAVIAESGIQVIGSDIDKEKVDLINKGVNPLIEEPGLSLLIKRHGGKNLKATCDTSKAASDCNVHIIIVPLFIDNSKKPDFSLLKTAASSLSTGLKKGDIVVVETTMPVGTTDNLIKAHLESGSGLKAGNDFYLAYSPERIMTGFSISRYRDFPKVIGGIDDRSTLEAFNVYKKFAQPIKVENAKTAELIKIAEGVYRDVNIALANEIFQAAEFYGVNFWQLREATRHEFCNILEPGNVGGHCIPVYPWFLINDMDFPLIHAARNVNDNMAEYYTNKITKIIGKKKDAKVGIIGLTYREGVKEDAYSCSHALIKILKKRGYFVYGLDPLYSKEEIKSIFKIENLIKFQDMDAIILMNKESRYKADLNPMRDRVIDVKNIFG